MSDPFTARHMCDNGLVLRTGVALSSADARSAALEQDPDSCLPLDGQSMYLDHVFPAHGWPHRESVDQTACWIRSLRLCLHGNLLLRSMVSALSQLLGCTDPQRPMQHRAPPSHHQCRLQHILRRDHDLHRPPHVYQVAVATSKESRAGLHIQPRALRHPFVYPEQVLLVHLPIRVHVDLLCGIDPVTGRKLSDGAATPGTSTSSTRGNDVESGLQRKMTSKLEYDIDTMALPEEPARVHSSWLRD
ncbi:hypothetical protein M8818_006335 [Zalaria obscura]|uniref:Uncharacterized protein n=1 Tax=Zalaria obscura TaxID=2024903 RepID=A0ACC3S5F6_9PEZI